MIKVLHVYRTFFPDTQGGLEETIRQIAKSSKELGAEVRVLTISKLVRKETWIEFDDIEVIQLPELVEISSCNIPYSGIVTFRKLAKWADVVHFHFPWPFADILKLFVPNNTRTVLTYHSDIIRQRFLSGFYSPLMHHFLNSVDRIVSTSPNYLATSDILKRYKDKVEIIPIGLSLTSYPEVDDAKLQEVKEEVGEGFFLFVGVIRYYKGLHILLNAAIDADFKIVIVGSGPIEDELKKQAEFLSLENVTFLGRVDNATKVALFKLCRAVVFPSYLRSEAFGVTLLEGAMFEKPLISTEIGTGTSYVNQHKETGLVVPPSDSHALRAAMDMLYEDNALAEQYGKNAKTRFFSCFTAQTMSEQYVGLYKRLISSNKSDKSITARHGPLPGDKLTLSTERPALNEYGLDDSHLTISTVLYKTGIYYVENHLEALITSSEVLFEETGITCHLFLIDNSNNSSYIRQVRYIIDAMQGLNHLTVTLIESPKNIGYGRANNLALPWTHSKYHLITNPDVIVSSETLIDAIAYMEKQADCGMLTPYVDAEANHLFHVVKRYPDCLSLVLRYLGSKRLSERFSDRLDRYACLDLEKTAQPVQIAGGCFMFMRTRLLLDMEGFDPRFFMYFEDFDLCMRIRKRAEIHWVPDVHILHYGGDVGRKGIKHHIFFIISAIKFFNRHGWKIF